MLGVLAFEDLKEKLERVGNKIFKLKTQKLNAQVIKSSR